MIRRPPSSPLFPYPPLFRSQGPAAAQNNSASPQVHSSIDPAKEADIRSLMELVGARALVQDGANTAIDRKSTRLNSSHANISYAVFCLKKKKLKYLFILIG